MICPVVARFKHFMSVWPSLLARALAGQPFRQARFERCGLTGPSFLSVVSARSGASALRTAKSQAVLLIEPPPDIHPFQGERSHPGSPDALVSSGRLSVSCSCNNVLVH